MAELRIFNPDGSEAELSGNGVREAVMYLRRAGWADDRHLLDLDRGGRDPPADHRADTCTVDMGRARLRPTDFPSAARTARGRSARPGASSRSSSCRSATRSARSRWTTGSRSWTSPRSAPPIERHELFPEPHQRLVLERARATRAIRARIFERGVGETMSSGTGATGAAVAAVLRGADSPVTVRLDGGELEVEVGEDLHVDLTGWAVPVYAGELSDEFVEELSEHEAERAAGPPAARTCSPSSSGRSPRRRPPGVDVISLGIGDPGHAHAGDS